MQQKIYRLFKKLRIKEESELGENKATIAMKKEKSLDLNACFKFIENTYFFFFPESSHCCYSSSSVKKADSSQQEVALKVPTDCVVLFL